MVSSYILHDASIVLYPVSSYISNSKILQQTVTAYLPNQEAITHSPSITNQVTAQICRKVGGAIYNLLKADILAGIQESPCVSYFRSTPASFLQELH